MVSRLFLCLTLIPEKQPKTLYPNTGEEVSMQGIAASEQFSFPPLPTRAFCQQIGPPHLSATHFASYDPALDIFQNIRRHCGLARNF